MRRLASALSLLVLQACVGAPVRDLSGLAAAPPASEAPPAASAVEPVGPASPAPGDPAPAASAAPAAAPTDEAHDEHHDEASHDGEDEGDDHEGSGQAARTQARIELTDEQIAEKAKKEPASLGSMSFGSPGAGYLINGVQMPANEQWTLVGAPHIWGTQETVDFIAHAIHEVNKRFANTHPLAIGDISAHHGGYLFPHKSHQAGRDVDLGFYYLTPEPAWYTRATSRNLDLPRTWALLKAFINDADVDMIFIDTQVQRLLAEHAAAAGEDAAFLDRVFQIRGKNGNPVVRHVKGHATHIHVRFHSPTAQELARRAQRFFRRPGGAAVAPKPGSRGAKNGQGNAPASDGSYVSHRARSGDVLVNLARMYGTSPEAIARANNLQGNALKVGQVYKIPVPPKNPPGGKPGGKPAGKPAGKPSRGLAPGGAGLLYRPYAQADAG